jgi:hypothetical protein
MSSSHVPIETATQVDECCEAEGLSCSYKNVVPRSSWLRGPLLEALELRFLQLSVHQLVESTRVGRKQGYR